MEQLVHEVRNMQWNEIVEQVNSSGLSKTAYCKQNGINVRQFFYYQSKLRKQAYNEMVKQAGLVSAKRQELTEIPFVEVPVSSALNTKDVLSAFSPSAVLCIGSVTVGINEDISEELLMKIGRMIRNAL